ncbi:MAG: hypothetical protein WBF58_06565 [Xanthobacteraceae bacterium]
MADMGRNAAQNALRQVRKSIVVILPISHSLGPVVLLSSYREQGFAALPHGAAYRAGGC